MKLASDIVYIIMANANEYLFEFRIIALQHI